MERERDEKNQTNNVGDIEKRSNNRCIVTAALSSFPPPDRLALYDLLMLHT